MSLNKSYVTTSLDRLSELGEIKELKYPKSQQRRSVDLAFRSHGRGALILKLSYDALMVGRQEREELRMLSLITGVNALVVSERRNDEKLLDDVVYDLDGVKVVNVNTLVKAINGEGPVIYEDNNEFKVKINGSALRTLRLRRGYSLGELARRLNVTRKAVYDYERGAIRPSIEVVEKMINELGEEMVEPIDIFDLSDEAGTEAPESWNTDFDNDAEHLILDLSSRMGFLAFHAKRSPLDIGIRADNEKFLLIVSHQGESLASISERAENAVKVTLVTNAKAYAVASDDSLKNKIRENVDVNEIFTSAEFLEYLRSLGAEPGPAASDNRKAGHRKDYPGQRASNRA